METEQTNSNQAREPSLRVQNLLPFRGPFARWPRTSDSCLALLVFMCSIFIPADNDHASKELVLRSIQDVPLLILLLLVVSSIAIVWRRQNPLFVLGITIGSMATATALGESYDFFGMPIALYSVGRYEVNTRLSLVGGFGIGLVALIQMFDKTETLPDIGSSFAILFLCWYFGRRVRARGDYLQLLRDRAEQSEKQRAYESKQAVEAERTRIARELHDVVAHQVSLMTVQAGAAKTVARTSPEKAISAMGEVEKAGRQALGELRQLLDVLRPDARGSDTAPQPGSVDLPELIKGFKKAGLQINESIELDDILLPASLDLTIYRVVQEALTNIVKHVGPSAIADVNINIDGHEVSIRVSDNGAKIPTKLIGLNEHGTQTGYGLIGMRERVHLAGGEIETQYISQSSNSSGGFVVACKLPLPQRNGI